MGMDLDLLPRGRDMEAGDFDENELDDLHASRGPGIERRDMHADRYDIGSDSDEEDDAGKRKEQR